MLEFNQLCCSTCTDYMRIIIVCAYIEFQYRKRTREMGNFVRHGAAAACCMRVRTVAFVQSGSQALRLQTKIYTSNWPGRNRRSVEWIHSTRIPHAIYIYLNRSTVCVCVGVWVRGVNRGRENSRRNGTRVICNLFGN